MASLNSPTELKLILEVPPEVTDPQLQAFLDAAHLVVTEDLAGAGLSEARLKLIEQYVAAHLALMLTERGGLTSSQIRDSRDTYANLLAGNQSGNQGLAMTRYGQQAIAFDTSGRLKAMATSTLSARFRVVSEFDKYGGIEEFQDNVIS